MLCFEEIVDIIKLFVSSGTFCLYVRSYCEPHKMDIKNY